MPVLVDTNVILDIAYDDATWADWSEGQLELQRQRGLIVNPMVYSELCAGAESVREVNEILSRLGLTLQELPKTALFLAAKAFLLYRRQGGSKTSPLPDFFIGAHAQASGFALLTRDSGRYKSYFPAVALVTP